MKRQPSSTRLACTLGVAISICAAGCGGSSPSPEATLARFAEALRARRYEEAYDLMDSRYRDRTSFELFRARLEESPTEAGETAESLSQVMAPAREEATIAVSIGPEEHEVRLVRESGAWRVATALVDFYDQSTPRSSLRSFVRAMERRRYDVVLRFVPDADAEGVTPETMQRAWEGDGREEIERLLSNLREAIDNPIEEVGDRATMPYAGRFSVRFVRERGAWKIDDPD